MNGATTTLLSWKNGWKSLSFRLTFVTTFALLFLLAYYVGNYFDFIESRNGPVLNDFVFNILPAADVTWIVFFFLYTGILWGLYSLRNAPQGILLIFQTYILVTGLRLICLYLFPLNPPADYIALREPIAQLFANNRRIISHDLFFSGHVSTICSVLFAVQKRHAKNYLILCAVMISVLVLVQRVHYTIDVVVALGATYACFLFAKKLLSFSANNLN